MRPRSSACSSPLRPLLALLFSSLLVAAPLATVLAVPAAADSAGSLLTAVNDARSARGLEPVASYGDATMATRANDHVVDTGGFHGRSEEASRWYRERGSRVFGENQAHFPAGSSGQAVVEAWLGSPGHADNLLASNVTHAAIAVRTAATGDGERTYYTLHLVDGGGPAPAANDAPEPVPEPAPEPVPDRDPHPAPKPDPSPSTDPDPPPDDREPEPEHVPEPDPPAEPDAATVRFGPLGVDVRQVLAGAEDRAEPTATSDRTRPVRAQRSVVLAIDQPAIVPVGGAIVPSEEPTLLTRAQAPATDPSLVGALMVLAVIALFVAGGWLGRVRDRGGRGGHVR